MIIEIGSINPYDNENGKEVSVRVNFRNDETQAIEISTWVTLPLHSHLSLAQITEEAIQKAKVRMREYSV